MHGGKYQFSDTQYLAGNSLIGQEFANSLYSAGDVDESSVDEQDDELPNWALKLQDSIEKYKARILDTYTLPLTNKIK